MAASPKTRASATADSVPTHTALHASGHCKTFSSISRALLVTERATSVPGPEGRAITRSRAPPSRRAREDGNVYPVRTARSRSRSSLPGQQARDQGRERGGFDRLGHVGVVARVERAAPVLGPRVGGERDGGEVAAVDGFEPTHPADQVIAVLAGHADVAHQHVGPAPL